MNLLIRWVDQSFHNQIAALFGRDKSVISKHLKGIYEEGELLREATVAKYATVQTEGPGKLNGRLSIYHMHYSRP